MVTVVVFIRIISTRDLNALYVKLVYKYYTTADIIFSKDTCIVI